MKAQLAKFIYIISSILLCCIIGAATYEHTVIWPVAYSEPPLSLEMFKGDYPISGAPFWSKIHPFVLLSMIISLAMNWKSASRKNLLVTLSGYIIIMIATSLYFVPELISIVSTDLGTEIDQDLAKRGTRWINLSLARLFALIGLAIYLLSGLADTQTNR